MKNLWREPGAWFFIACLGVVLTGCVSTLLWFQRSDYQRRLDASVVSTVEHIRKEIEVLRQDRDSIRRKQDAIERKIEAKP